MGQSMNDLNDNILKEIFSRLPVKYVLRCKSVCKSWYALLNSSHFLAMHSNQAHDSRLLFLESGYYDRSSFYNEMSVLTSEIPEVRRDRVDLSFIGDGKGIDLKIYGPSNGILCLHKQVVKNRDDSGDGIALWNPTIKDIKVLPVSTLRRCPDSHFSLSRVGFGFDRKTNDYKVVKVILSRATESSTNDSRVLQFQVYSLKSDSWGQINVSAEDSDIDCAVKSSIYFNGVHYWMTSAIIHCFDVVDEIFYCIPLPDYPNYGYLRSCEVLTVLKDSLAVIGCYLHPYNYRYWEVGFDIWVMNSENKSWIWQFNIGSNLWPCRLLGFRNNHNILFQSLYDPLISYQLTCQQFKDLERTQGLESIDCAKTDLGSIDWSTKVIIFAESLVSVSRRDELEFY